MAEDYYLKEEKNIKMGMFKKFFGYEAKLKCENCGFMGEIRIPKGITVKEFIKTGMFKCDNCSCMSKPKEYKTKWLD